METKEVELSTLVEDLELWPRGTIDETHISQLVEALRAGAEFPLMRVSKKNLKIVDGIHRKRAYQRFGKTKVTVEIKSYQSDKELYLEATALNSSHGRKLMPYDHVRVVKKAGELGISDVDIANALSITLDKVQSIKVNKFAEHRVEVVPLRGTVQHLAGKEITDTQFEGIKKTGGWRQGWYIRQVIILLKHDLVDWESEGIVQQMEELHDLLENALKKLSIKA